MEEAVCHALCEVIERDVGIFTAFVSIFHSLLYLGNDKRFIENGRQKEYPFSKILAGDTFVDDPGIFIDIDISEIAEEFEPIGRLVKNLPWLKSLC